MKKLISLFVLLLVVLGATAQERTVGTLELSKNPLSGNYSYYNYTGTSSDVLVPTTLDTIDVVFLTKKTGWNDVTVICKFDPVLGADTIVYIQILGKNSTNESYTTIRSDSSAVVTTDGVVKAVATYDTYNEQIVVDTTSLSTALASTKDSVSFYISNVTYSAVSYRYITIRLILAGDDSVGTGVELKQLELKLNER